MTDLSFAAALTSIVTFAVAAGSPGPATLAVAATSMAAGRARGVAMALGLGLGLAVWGVAAVLGMGLLIAKFAPALIALKLTGAAFLFYLAYKAGRSALRPAPGAAEAMAAPARTLFMRGLMLNLLNPKGILAWVAALTLGAPHPGIAAICAFIGVMLYLCYAMLFSLAPVRAGYRRAARWIDGACAALFGLAGLRLLTWRAPV